MTEQNCDNCRFQKRRIGSEPCNYCVIQKSRSEWEPIE